MRNRIRFLREGLVRMRSQPVIQLIAHAYVDIQKAQTGLAIGATPGYFGIAFYLEIAIRKFKRKMCETGGLHRLGRQYVDSTAAYIQQNAFGMFALCQSQRDRRLYRHAERLPALAFQHGGCRAQGCVGLLMDDGFDEDEMRTGSKNRPDFGRILQESQGDCRRNLYRSGAAPIRFQHLQGSLTVVEVDNDLVEVLFFQTSDGDVGCA